MGSYDWILISSEYDRIKELSTPDLIEIASEVFDSEAAAEALVELSGRDKAKVLELNKEILSNDKGDGYLQGFVCACMFEDYPAEALEVMYQWKAEIHYALLGAIIKGLTKNLSWKNPVEVKDEFIEMLIRRYNELDEWEYQFVVCNFDEFLEVVEARKH